MKETQKDIDKRENPPEALLIKQVGMCRFCGQTHMIQTEDKWTDPQLEEEATRICECDEAKAYQDSVTKKERTKKRIDELCGEGAGSNFIHADIADGLKKFADYICDKRVKEISVTVTSGEKVKIKMLAKDKVKIERSKTNIKMFEE
ncbi:hypothetical protein [Diplocloster modestus]|uniref:Uncharacterized protein n=1 Tax=Diplocloster modestus TaxID=2850322 RepID=A0ABS6KCN5_9FIRM|nr:hypothetical protein [Diplocloster modestus]MBU9728286.1 hypothetical protein [Diplocloster modestus]